MVSVGVAPGLDERQSCLYHWPALPSCDTADCHTGGHYHQTHLQDLSLGEASVVEDGEESAAHHDADHEAREDHAEGSVAGVEDRRPEEHEDVHAGLEEGLAGPEEEDLSVAEDDPQPLDTAATEVILPVPEVLLPGVDDEDPADHQREQGHHKGSNRAIAESLGSDVRNDSWTGEVSLYNTYIYCEGHLQLSLLCHSRMWSRRK